MINSKNELKKYLEADYNYYRRALKRTIIDDLTHEHLRTIWKYIKYLRYEEYYLNCNRKIMRIIYTRKKNIIGNKLGFYIIPNTVEKGITICHHGNVIINGSSKIGENCTLHGDNCIGNNGITKDSPIIGNNVNIGIGAKIIGKVFIANNVKIGANAVVIKSCYNEGATLVGVPAREVKNEGQ